MSTVNEKKPTNKKYKRAIVRMKYRILRINLLEQGLAHSN